MKKTTISAWNELLIQEFQKVGDGFVEPYVAMACSEITKTIPIVTKKHYQDVYVGGNIYHIDLEDELIAVKVLNTSIPCKHYFDDEKLIVELKSFVKIDDGLMVEVQYHTEFDACEVPRVLYDRLHDAVLYYAKFLIYGHNLFEDSTKAKMNYDLYSKAIKSADLQRFYRATSSRFLTSKKL